MKKLLAALCLALCLGLLLASCSPAPLRTAVAAIPGILRATPTPTPPLCPAPTAEFLSVEPVTSPTSELSQVVIVNMWNMEMATVTTESGIFSASGGEVEIHLLPNSTHHLLVEAKVKQITTSTGCVYGGYTLHTTTDRTGAPLVIVQGQAPSPITPAEAIGAGNADRLQILTTFSAEAQSVTDFTFLDNGTLLSVGYGDAAGRIYGRSLVTGEKVLDVSGPEAEALVVTASPDGAMIATGGTATDPAVRLWDVKSGSMRELGRHDYYLESVSFSPSGALLASGDNGNTVRVWDVKDGQLVTTLSGDVPGRLQAFTALYWPDDKTLMAGGSNAVYTWDVATGRLVRRVPGPEGVQFLVETAFADGGRRLAAVAQDSRLYLWAGQWSAWEMPEGGAVLASVAFSPNGRLVVAGTYEDVFFVWDAAGGTLLATRKPSGPASGCGVGFSPDGRYLATGGWEAPIRVWGVP